MNVVYRYPLRISPTNAELLRQWSCATRYLWNRSLRLSTGLYKRYNKSMGFYGETGYNKRLTTLRGRYNWLSDVPNCIQQKCLMNLDQAFKNFFRRIKRGETPGYPRFKNRSELPGLYFPKQRFTIRIDEEGRHYLNLSKMPQEIRIDVDRPYLVYPEDSINSVTLVYDRMWYICILVTTADPTHVRRNLPSVGLDMGVAQTVTRSDGVVHQIDMNRIKYLEDRISHLQVKLSRKVGSKKFEKKSGHWLEQRGRIGKLQSELANIRRNFNDQTSRIIVDNFDRVVVEDLKIKNMTATASGTIEDPGKNVSQKSGLNRAILRNGWFQLRTMLEYKSVKVGAEVIAIPPHYTSQMCSQCGYTNADNRETQSVFICKSCGYSANADINAAVNILKKSPAGSPG